MDFATLGVSVSVVNIPRLPDAVDALSVYPRSVEVNFCVKDDDDIIIIIHSAILFNTSI